VVTESCSSAAQYRAAQNVDRWITSRSVLTRITRKSNGPRAALRAAQQRIWIRGNLSHANSLIFPVKINRSAKIRAMPTRLAPFFKIVLLTTVFLPREREGKAESNRVCAQCFNCKSSLTELEIGTVDAALALSRRQAIDRDPGYLSFGYLRSVLLYPRHPAPSR
jgi:hypothetical protein